MENLKTNYIFGIGEVTTILDRKRINEILSDDFIEYFGDGECKGTNYVCYIEYGVENIIYAIPSYLI